MMFGLGDWAVTAAYLGSVAVTLVCVVYGAINWNRSDDDITPEPVKVPVEKEQ